MKVIFIGSFYPEKLYAKIRKSSLVGIDDASNNFQRSLILGFKTHYIDFQVITCPFTRTFPKHNKNWRHRFYKLLENDTPIFSLPYLNIFLLNHLTKIVSVILAIRKFIFINQNLLIYIYSLHTPFIIPAILLKLTNKEKVKICLIVPDLQENMTSNKSLIFLFFKNIDKLITSFLIKYVDSFVLLTDLMKNKLELVNKPYIVVEGICNNTNQYTSSDKLPNTVMYSGSLDIRYGIDILLDSFSHINDSKVELLICGDGDMRNQIKEYSLINDQIKYLGHLPNCQVLELQRKVSLLVNPRPSKDLFTLYSFPSKIIEYLNSGTPTIMFKLPGIPEEYFDYCFVPSDETSDSLAREIIKVINMDNEFLNKFGLSASNFVKSKKNNIIQTERIKKLNSIFYER